MFRPRSAVATPTCDLSNDRPRHEAGAAVLLAPVGSSRMFYPRGEEAAAREAGDAGTAYILSTLSGCRLEDVKAATRGPAWYQLYLAGGRDVALRSVERARTAGFTALVVTIDTPVAGLRERDVRNGVKELLTRNPWTMAAVRVAVPCAPAMARRLRARRRADDVPERGARRLRADAVCRCRRGARAVHGVAGTTCGGFATRGRDRS